MIEFILNQPLFIILVFSVLGIWVMLWHYAPKTSTKLSDYIDRQKIAALEYNLELTPKGRTDATDRVIDDIDKQLAEMGVFEAQLACAEKKIRVAAGVQPYSSYDTMKAYVWDCNGPRNHIPEWPSEALSSTRVKEIYDKAFPGTSRYCTHQTSRRHEIK